jgi:hypothetical protein
MIDPKVSDPVGTVGVLGIALAFFAGACILFVALGPSLATLHAFAGFIVLAIVAAANQLIPFLTGVSPAHPRVVLRSAAPLALGFVALIAAFLGAVPGFVIGAVLLSAGSIAWAAWTFTWVVRAPLEKSFGTTIMFSSASFVATALLGSALALALGGFSGSSILGFAPAHALLAIVAFGSATIVAIAYRFVPMFALAHTQERKWQRLPQWLVLLAGLAGAAAVQHPLVLRMALAITLVAAAAAANTHLQTLRARMRRKLDVSLRYAITAWVFALCALALAFTATWQPAAAIPAVACAVLGWLNITILGYGYKIIGFLIWEMAKTRWPSAVLPPLDSSLPEGLALVALSLLVLGTVGSGLALGIPLPQFERAAFGIYAIGGCCAILTFLRLVLTYARNPSSCATTPSSVSTTAASNHRSQ